MLDDAIILQQKQAYFSDINNVGSFFTNSFFNNNDGYYRPVLALYFLALSIVAPAGTILLYHLMNLIIHLLNIYLLSVF
jgi:hypothetical protein